MTNGPIAAKNSDDITGFSKFCRFAVDERQPHSVGPQTHVSRKQEFEVRSAASCRLSHVSELPPVCDREGSTVSRSGRSVQQSEAITLPGSGRGLGQIIHCTSSARMLYALPEHLWRAPRGAQV